MFVGMKGGVYVPMRSGWLGDVLGETQNRGFLWGLGTAAAAYYLWPTVQGVFRPAAKNVIRGTMAAGERFRYTMTRAKEALEDVMAEAQFERMRDVAGPDPEPGPAAS